MWDDGMRQCHSAATISHGWCAHYEIVYARPRLPFPARTRRRLPPAHTIQPRSACLVAPLAHDHPWSIVQGAMWSQLTISCAPQPGPRGYSLELNMIPGPVEVRATFHRMSTGGPTLRRAGALAALRALCQILLAAGAASRSH